MTKKEFFKWEPKKLMVLLGLCVLFVLILFLSGCEDKGGGSRADQIQAHQTATAMAEAQRQVGMPNIVNFQQRKLMKLIYELCDKEDVITYAYIKSDYQGKLFFIGKCIGYGIPFSAQFTNPKRLVDADDFVSNNTADDIFVLPQADPNGLFMPTSSSATWLMMIDPETSESRPVYIEPEIVVSPFPLH